MIRKEKLVRLLDDAVREAHQQEPGAIGLVLFGSRTYPDSHPRAATPSSDVDLVYVLRGTAPESFWLLSNVVVRRLSQKGLRQDMSNVLLVDSMDAMDRYPGSIYRAIVWSTCRYFDECSVAITTEKDVTSRINQLINLFGKKSTDGRI